MSGGEIETHSLSGVFFGRLERDTGIQPFQGFLVCFQLAGLRTVEVRRQKMSTTNGNERNTLSGSMPPL